MGSIIGEAVKFMDINQQKSSYLAHDITLPERGRVLISWQDSFLEQLILKKYPYIKIDCLMDMDYAAFIEGACDDRRIEYNCILDNGLLFQTDVDAGLLRAMGMHLTANGAVRSVFPSSMNKEALGRISFANNFDVGKCLSVSDAGENSFYVAEFSSFCRTATWLQNFFTTEVRRKLAYLLLRLDFGIHVDDTKKEILQLCQKHEISEKYLSVFIESATIHTDGVRTCVASLDFDLQIGDSL